MSEQCSPSRRWLFSYNPLIAMSKDQKIQIHHHLKCRDESQSCFSLNALVTLKNIAHLIYFEILWRSFPLIKALIITSFVLHAAIIVLWKGHALYLQCLLYLDAYSRNEGLLFWE